MFLTEPTLEFDRQIRVFRQEFLDSGESMDGTSRLRRFEEPKDWIDFLNAQNHPLTRSKERVPGLQLIYVREQDQKIVGMIDLRFTLNAYLEKYGGHVGYSVAPGERKKGYATQMLGLVLPIFQEAGINKVLVTCLKGNEGSRKTILKNGGIYESTVYEPDEKADVERYWIALDSET